MTEVLTRGTLTINIEQCKGCELCIPACRPGVLRMSSETNRHGFAYPELSEGCTACRACYDICPDFVFDVFRYAVPVASVSDEEGD
jgi:2-oxoglutarate ferredoxin oxidoreductase subunit delta